MEKKNKFDFIASGSDLFFQLVSNSFLTVITLGIYYPWAKADNLKYYYWHTEFDALRFQFLGTGNEMFKGFLKVLLIIVPFYALSIYLQNIKMAAAGSLILYFVFFLLFPIALHGTLRYRLSRTSYNLIRFEYTGDLKEIVILFFKGSVFSVITLGVYTPWLFVSIRKYAMSHIKYSDLNFSYSGKGKDMLLLNIKGGLLSVITLGIYSCWYFSDLTRYKAKHSWINDTYNFESSVTGLGIFKIYTLSFFQFIFTLGFGYAWIVARNKKYFISNLSISENFDSEAIKEQLVEKIKEVDSTGDGLGDFIDLDLA